MAAAQPIGGLRICHSRKSKSRPDARPPDDPNTDAAFWFFGLTCSNSDTKQSLGKSNFSPKISSCQKMPPLV